MESKIVKKNGNAFIEIDGKCFEPLMFRSFRQRLQMFRFFTEMV